MDNKLLSKEINNTLNYKTSHINSNCNLIKNIFIDNCRYDKTTKITLEYIYINSNCIKMYNDYYDCYKNDKLLNHEINYK